MEYRRAGKDSAPDVITTSGAREAVPITQFAAMTASTESP